MKANRWIPLLVFCWGIVTTLTGLVQNFGGLVAVRFILGMCEGGLLPGIVSAIQPDILTSFLTGDFSGFVSEYYLQAPRTAIAVSRFRSLVVLNFTHNAALGYFMLLVGFYFYIHAMALICFLDSLASLSGAFGGLFENSRNVACLHDSFLRSPCHCHHQNGRSGWSSWLALDLHTGGDRHYSLQHHRRIYLTGWHIICQILNGGGKVIRLYVHPLGA
jgi:hypothetical protein